MWLFQGISIRTGADDVCVFLLLPSAGVIPAGIGGRSARRSMTSLRNIGGAPRRWAAWKM